MKIPITAIILILIVVVSLAVIQNVTLQNVTLQDSFRKGPSKIDNFLNELIQSENYTEIQEKYGKYGLSIVDNEVRVDITLANPDYTLPPDVGIETGRFGRVLSALVKINKILELSDDPEIKFIRASIAQLQTDKISGKGFLKGKVVIGPICPVERFPSDPACQPTEETYKAWPIAVYTSDEKAKVAQIEPNLDGTYILGLPEGNYVIDLENQKPFRVGKNNLPSTTIMIRSGETATFDIDIDTGIR